MSLSSEGTPDMVAFEQLVAEYGDRVFGIALRVTGSPSDAEEVMQEAFLQAFRSWSTYRGEAAPTTWLYRIAVNAALMRVRARRSEELLSEHRDLDDVIARISESRPFDQLQLQRLKKRKLMLKDQIARLKSRLIPDVIA